MSYDDFQNSQTQDRERLRRRMQERRRRQREIRIKIALLSVSAVVILAGTLILLVHLFRSKNSGENKGQKTEVVALEPEESSEIPEEYSEELPEEDLVIEEDTPGGEEENQTGEGEDSDSEGESVSDNTPEGFFRGYSPVFTGETAQIPDSMTESVYGILIDISTGNVVAAKNADEVMYPASMTKILTVLTAMEYEPDMDDIVTMTDEIAQYTYDHDCSRAGFSVSENIPVRDLFYGTILPSGADAVLMLSNYCTPDREEFVQRMNEKARELGLSEEKTHFENPIGLFSEDNHCTVTDMAMILKAAEENEFLREVLRSRKYTTTPSIYHPDGIELSNLFLRRIEDKDTHGFVAGAKTGYVNQSGNCAASFMEGDDGINYICVTGKAQGSWNCIEDHVKIYDKYVPGGTVSENSENSENSDNEEE
ncbi:MAG: serine hydrolase [Lachnospiraceae bacterium]|nr:serine hydrolase [Lachnospiraceae bacterium]